MWLLAILRLPLDWIQTLFHAVAHVLLWLTIAYAIASRFHWMQRIWIAWAQRKLSQLANGAPVTLGTFQMDIFRGRVYITDIIIHTPQREEWGWDSPLVARIGRLEAHLNPCSWLDGWMAPPKIRDIYGLYVTDVQVFCEKRANVFNFHLLDPSLELPDPQHIQRLEQLRLSSSSPPNADLESSHPNSSTIHHTDTNNNGTTATLSTHGTSSSQHNTGTSTTTSATGGSLGDNPSSHSSASATTVGAQPSLDMDGKGTTTKERSKSSIRAEHKANEIMEQVLGAVSSIGRAVVNKEHLGRALVEEQKDGLVLQLKQFQSSSVETIASEGKQVLAELGKMVGQNVSTLKQQVFLKPPPKRANYTPPSIKEEFRFGRVVLREICFFTKQIISLNNTSNNRTTNSSNSNHGASRDGGGPSEEGNPAFLSSSSSEPNPNKNGRYYHDVDAWSKPILIREVMVSAAELCPPMSAKDEAGDPAVGQSLEQTFDVVLKRTLTESAKTNTGRLLQSVFGQVLFERPRRDTPAPTAEHTHKHSSSSSTTPHQNNLSSHGSTATVTSSMATASNSNSAGSLVSSSDLSRQRLHVTRASNYY